MFGGHRCLLLDTGMNIIHQEFSHTKNRVNDAQVEGLDGFWGYIYKSDSGHALKLWHNIFAGSSKTAQTGKSRQLRFHEFVHQHGECNEMMKT